MLCKGRVGIKRKGRDGSAEYSIRGKGWTRVGLARPGARVDLF